MKLMPETTRPADGTTGDPDGDHNVYLTVAECSMVVTLTDDRVKFVSSSSSKVTNTALNGDDEVVVVVYVDESSSSYDTSRTLSDSYSFAAVKAEGAALLAEWDMGDDRVYPWRMDGETWRAPLVHRDAASSGPAITEGDYTPAYELPEIDVDGSLEYHHGGTLTWTNPTPFTGAVIGKPQAVGNGRYFDDHARVLQVCCPPGLELNTNGGGNWFCLSGWGELSPGTLPLTATHWPDVQKGGMFPKGAFMMQADEGVYFQKWAESLEEWPSANMARPFGRDRFLIDYDAATGIGDCTGTGTSAEEYAGDIILDSGDPFYAFRRFPDCRPIGSRLVITAAVQTSPGVVTLTVAENHWLLAGDVLDFYGVPGLTIGDAVATATPDTTVFTVAGTLTGSYSSGGYVTSHLTAEDTHRWDWTCPRHAFVAQTWLTTVRANGGYHYTQEQGYLPPAKKTSVLYFSPNAESFENGFNAGWGDMESDDCFPNRWHAAFLQAVADPLWKSPKQCSDDAAVFKTQPAPCTACTGAAACVDFFPLVEPLLAPPANAPAVPFFFPASFDGGLPLPPIHLCAVPDANPTIHALRAAWLACDLWKTVIHNKCTRTADPSGESGSIGAGNNDYGAGGNGGIGL